MSSTAQSVRLALWLWFFAAIAAGYYLLLQRIPPLAIPGVIFGLSALSLLAYFKIIPLRLWIDALDSRALVQLHLSRFVGIYFLVLYRRGELPYDFAVKGGIGDIIVAAFAAVLIFVPFAAARLQRLLTIWNIVGLIDILLVVLTAARINRADPSQLHALTHLPLSLLPTFLVPLIIATHVILFVRLNRQD